MNLTMMINEDHLTRFLKKKEHNVVNTFVNKMGELDDVPTIRKEIASADYIGYVQNEVNYYIKVNAGNSGSLVVKKTLPSFLNTWTRCWRPEPSHKEGKISNV